MPSSRQKAVGTAAAALILVVIAALAIGSRRSPTGSPGPGGGCIARSHGATLQLGTDQAAIAATIAGVAQQRAMPERAVTIAFAAALQESRLQNLPYGDRDSVGVFQQRPSQGWGTARQLLDPVYASTRFFAALAAVPGYQRLPIYRAAQDVQHSADGFAYSQYAPMGKTMAGPFTGRTPRAVWCWFGPPVSGVRRLAAASSQLARTFGSVTVSADGRAGRAVLVDGKPGGWAVAAWLVTHAPGYGIRQVSYLGYRWSATRGADGWTADPRRHPGHGHAGLRQTNHAAEAAASVRFG